MSKELKSITQEVIIRPIRVGKTRHLSGKFTDKLRKQTICITKREQCLTGENADKVQGFEIMNITFNEAVRQYNMSYVMMVDEDGKIDREAMSSVERAKMQVCEAWALHPQMQHVEATDRKNALELNPNLVDPWFTIEFVGRINLTLTLAMFEKYNVFKNFFELPNSEKLDCCFFMGHNPVENGNKVSVTNMMVAMADFNNGILQSSAKNREKFLNIFIPNRKEAIDEAIINKAFKLNIVSYKVDGYYVEKQNIGVNEENARAKIQKDSKLFDFIKEELASKELQVEDDWVKSIKPETFKIDTARKAVDTAKANEEVQKISDDTDYRARAKELGIKWHFSKPVNDELKELVRKAEKELLKEA